MLDSEVDYAHQRHEVEGTVRHVRGVVGITNTSSSFRGSARTR
jgi:hypothetical protein